MIPPAVSRESVAGRLARSAWRAVVSAARARHSSVFSHVQHGAIWLTVKVAKLQDARALARATARILPPLSVQSAQDLYGDLSNVGTCLSRALTVASRLPHAEVALGFDPSRAPHFRPHAWVIFQGQPLIATDFCPTILSTIPIGS